MLETIEKNVEGFWYIGERDPTKARAGLECLFFEAANSYAAATGPHGAFYFGQSVGRQGVLYLG